MPLFFSHSPWEAVFWRVQDPGYPSGLSGFMAIDAATVVYYRCDIILLEYLTGNSAEVGYYSAAYRFLEGVVLMAVPLRVIWFRKLRLVWEDRRFFENQVLKMGLGMLGAACLVIGIGVPFSQEIM